MTNFAHLSRMALRLPLHAIKSHRLVRTRYLDKQPVVGSIPYEVRLHERYWEKHLHVDTGGWEPTNVDDGMLYEATPYLLVVEMLRALNLGPDDVFVDLGCGKGRVVCMAALTGAGRVVGVEQDAGFLEAARENLSHLPAHTADVDFVLGLAQSVDFDDATVVFIFNAFGSKTLQEVLDLLAKSLERKPRRLRIVYANPQHDHVLGNTQWLDNVAVWPKEAYPEVKFLPTIANLVTFWEAKSPAL